MKIRLYMDEDAMSKGLAAALRKQGVEVTTVHNAGMIGCLDEQQLKYAAEQGYVLYSFNAKDFYSLHTRFLEQGQSHAGIILTPQGRYSIGEQMRRLLRLIAARPAEEMVNQVEFLSAWN